MTLLTPADLRPKLLAIVEAMPEAVNPTDGPGLSPYPGFARAQGDHGRGAGPGAIADLVRNKGTFGRVTWRDYETSKRPSWGAEDYRGQYPDAAWPFSGEKSTRR